jgi:hypothetical protein
MKGHVSDLADFLLTRIDDDQDQARHATPGPWQNVRVNERADGWNVGALGADGTHYDVAVDHGSSTEGACGGSDSTHIVRWDPMRVVAECETKRRIVEYCASQISVDEQKPGGTHGMTVLLLMALPYASHRDYRPEWRP